MRAALFKGGMAKTPPVLIVSMGLLAAFALSASWAGGHATDESERKLFGAIALSCASLLLIPCIFVSQSARPFQLVSAVVGAVSVMCLQLYFNAQTGLSGALFGSLAGAVLGLAAYWILRFKLWVNNVSTRHRRAVRPEAKPIPSEIEDQTRKAPGYFLVGLGGPIAIASLWIFVPHRGAPSLWETAGESSDRLVALLVSGGVGVAMVLAGVLILRSAKRAP